MEIYLVSVCNYEYELVIGYFTDEQKAIEYCKLHNNDNEYYNDMKYYVKKIKKKESKCLLKIMMKQH